VWLRVALAEFLLIIFHMMGLSIFRILIRLQGILFSPTPSVLGLNDGSWEKTIMDKGLFFRIRERERSVGIPCQQLVATPSLKLTVSGKWLQTTFGRLEARQG